jgi:hypothetical protein
MDALALPDAGLPGGPPAATPAPAVTPPPTAAAGPLSDHDLWNQYVGNGVPEDSATALVKQRGTLTPHDAWNRLVANGMAESSATALAPHGARQAAAPAPAAPPSLLGQAVRSAFPWVTAFSDLSDANPGVLRTFAENEGNSAALGLGTRGVAAYRAMTGDGSYASNRDALAAGMAADQAAHPTAALAGKIGGALGSPVNYLLPGAAAESSLGVRALTGAVAGAGVGAVQGAAASPDDDPAHLFGGAVIGGTLGGGIGGIGGAAAPSLSRVFAAFRGGAPLDRAQIAVRDAVTRSGGMPAVTAQNTALGSAGLGNMATVADLSPALGSLATKAAQADPALAGQMASTVAARGGTGGAASRIASSLPSTTLAGRLGQLETARQATFDPLYDALRQANPSISGSALRPLLPVLQQAPVRAALNAAKLTGMIGDVPDLGSPVSYSQMLDVKKALDDATESAFKSGNGNLGTRLGQARDQIDNFLSANITGHRQLATAYRGAKQLESALQDGAAAYGSGVDARDIPAALAALPSGAQQEFRTGLLTALSKDIRSGKITPAAYAPPEIQDKLRAAFGGNPAAFTALMGKVHGEDVLSNLSAPVSAGASPPGLTGGDMVRGTYLSRWLGPLGFAGAAARPAFQAGLSARSAAQAARVGALTGTQGTAAIDALLRSIREAPASLAPTRIGSLAASASVPVVRGLFDADSGSTR